MATKGSSKSRYIRQLDNFACPVCGRYIESLGKLNKHLDIDHRFDDESLEPNKKTSRSNTISSRAQNIIKKQHWEKPDCHGKAICKQCGNCCSRPHSSVNCRKCGLLYCNLHCRNIIKLNLDAQYDPLNGKWYACCYKCFSGKPGYNDYGAYVDKTALFVKLRQKKNEDTRLRVLQLENRLVRLANGIAFVHVKCKSNILTNLTIGSEMSRLEKTVTPWKDDKSVLDCSLCRWKFGITFWKHHCRLCGNIVCNRDETTCSCEISIQHLVNATNDLPYQSVVLSELAETHYSVRLCYKCIGSLYGERKFKKDIRKHKPPILSLCESLNSTAKVISDTISYLEGYMAKMDDSRITKQIPKKEDIIESKKLRNKLLRSVTMYNSLARQVSEFTPTNTTEAKIKRSMQVASSSFINEKVLTLKETPAMMDDSSLKIHGPVPDSNKPKGIDLIFNNLTIPQVKKYREELMVLKEQRFLVESMIKNAKRQRKFDEVATLSTNLHELTTQIVATQTYLGDEGFT